MQLEHTLILFALSKSVGALYQRLIRVDRARVKCLIAVWSIFNDFYVDSVVLEQSRQFELAVLVLS